MSTLIIKLGATGDVVRTTPLLRWLPGDVTWITAEKNLPLLHGIERAVRVLPWSQRHLDSDRDYELVINLEDDVETAAFLAEINFERLFGAHRDADGAMTYTADSRPWFDLSLISRFGRREADARKLRNRETYQALVFRSLGFSFAGEEYSLPPAGPTDLAGDVAIAPMAGEVWPMKKWAYYEELSAELRAQGLIVNLLPTRDTLLKHLADVQAHRCLVSGDSLPMHLALGSGVHCVTIFNCTSPWEIHDYGRQIKCISPRLEEFFYKRGFDEEATTAVSLDEVLAGVKKQLTTAPAAALPIAR